MAKVIRSTSSCSEVVSCLRKNGLIAIPTDTIYGIACLAQSTSSIQRIYDIKKRVNTKPLAICVPTVSHIEKYARIDQLIDSSILNKLLPGPVTIVLPRTQFLNPEINPSISSIGIRVIGTDFMLRFMTELDEAIALTSANKSGGKSSLQIDDFSELHPDLDFVIDGGYIEGSRAGSTVVDLSQKGFYNIIRDGEALERTEKELIDLGYIKLPEAENSC